MSEKKAKSLTKILSAEEAFNQPLYRRLGFLNGVFIGLSLALGVWGMEAVSLADVPVLLQYPSLVLGALVLIGLNGFTGWLTSHYEGAGRVMLVWLVSAVLSSFVISYQPYYGRTLTIWLADLRFWGLPIFPFQVDRAIAPVLAGFFIILLFVILALLQNYRLEGVFREVGENGRLLAYAWFLLLLPFPFVAGAGFITRDVVGDPSADAIQLVHRAIQRGRAYEGDLFELGLKEGINYSAIQGVREQMSGDYTLAIGGIDSAAAMTFIVAHFNNGAWINCRILSESLSFCYDAAPPYTIGLTSLLTGESPPETCRGCLPQVSAQWQGWLRAKGDYFTAAPRIQRQAQWGGYVLMRIDAKDYALECWFNGISPVQLERCKEVEN